MTIKRTVELSGLPAFLSVREVVDFLGTGVIRFVKRIII